MAADDLSGLAEDNLTRGRGAVAAAPLPAPNAPRKAVSSPAVIGMFVLGMIAFLRFAAPFVLPVVVSLLLHFLLRPVVLSLERARCPRPLSAILVLSVFFGGMALGLSYLQAPARDWLAKVPESVRKLEKEFRDFGSRLIPLRGVEEDPAPPALPDGPDAPKRTTWMTGLEDKVLSYTALTLTASFLSGCLETVVLLFFLLATGDSLLRQILRAIPQQRDKDEAVLMVQELQQNVSAYLVTTAAINLAVGAIVAVGMHLLGLPNPLLWGVLAALLNFIPYFGPFIMFLVLLLAGSMTFEGAARGLIPGLAYLGIHATESNLLTPSALGSRLTLSPLIIFLALMFWTWLWGIPGALLAVPLLMILKIFCEHFKGLKWLGELLSA